MICKVCEKEIPDGSNFCPECGARLFNPKCLNCGGALTADNKFCPNCGRPTSAERKPYFDTSVKPTYAAPHYNPVYEERVPKKKTPFFRRFWFWAILVFAVLVVALGSSPSAPSDPVLNEGEYKEKCVEIAYEDLARNPDARKGQYFRFTGEVVQVMESFGTVSLRVNVTPVMFYGEVSYYEDTIFVETKLGSDGRRILEGDMITLYGTCSGLYTYTTVLGSQMSIPGLEAGYWEIIN